MTATITERPSAESPEVDWRWVSSTVVRQGDHPPVPAPIPGLLEGRVTLIAGAGGAGKTTLTEQLIRHMCSQQQLGKFELPEGPRRAMRGWCLYLEDVEAMAQDRSLRVAPYGSIWEDDREQSNVRYLFGRGFRPYDLEQQLEQAKEEGKLPGVVIIDHLRILIGPQPAGIGPNDWERRNLLRLIAAADKYGCHIVVLTHLNKEGKISGTTELINSVDTAYVIEPNAEDASFATLSCKKMRMSPEVDYPLMKKMNGTWGFTTQVWVSETMAIGIARDIVRILKSEGRKTLSELVQHHALNAERAGIRSALTRGRRRGWFRLFRGHWEAHPQAGDDMLQAPDAPAEGPRAAPPIPRQPAAPVAEQAPAAAAAPDDDAQLLEDERWWEADQAHAEVEVFPALKILKESCLKRSRYHPIGAIERDKRDAAPWSLITEGMGGEPSWTAPGWTERRHREVDDQGRRRIRRELLAPDGTDLAHLLTMDRNGSFPSACSSVPLAPNLLTHQGPQDRLDRDLAGIYLVPIPEWDTEAFPHPLGRIARGRAAGDQVWISTPHMRLLDDLANQHKIARTPILDAYLGKSNGSLFDHFYRACREKRVELVTDGGEEYTLYKRSLSTALRLLWPKETRSPFWRPDWRVSMVAESTVRHWIKAAEAVEMGKDSGVQLVSMANTDEVAFLTPDGELPGKYEEGTRFGQIKIKRRGGVS